MTHRNTATPITSFILMVCAVTLLFQPQASFAKGKEPILLGTSTALTGPANALGRSMVRGMQSHFKHINATNEIEGYSVELKALDDGYHKESAELQMGKLIEQHGVLAVLGNVGTPTATKTVPLANHHKVPLIGAFTGANVLRKPEPDRYIINYRASYDEEMAKVVNSLLDNDVNPDRIAFFTQKDSFGNAGYNGAVKALKSRGVKNTEKLARGYYEANTLHVKDGLMEIIGARPTPKAD